MSLHRIIRRPWEAGASGFFHSFFQMWKSLAGDFLKDKSSIDKIDLCNKKTKKESEREKINHIPKQNDPGKKNLKTKKHSFWKVNLERFLFFFKWPPKRMSSIYKHFFKSPCSWVGHVVNVSPLFSPSHYPPPPPLQMITSFERGLSVWAARRRSPTTQRTSGALSRPPSTSITPCPTRLTCSPSTMSSTPPDR